MQLIRGRIERAQKVVIYGPEGIGKTSLAAQFPNPLFIDTEGGTTHLDVVRTPQPSSWTMLKSQIDYVKKNPDICSTLVIDTADWAEQLCADDICARYQKKSIEEFGYGKGYVYLAEEFARFLHLLNDLIDVGINVVLTAHAQMRKFEQPDEMGAYDRWEMKLQKKTAPIVKEWADIVLFANYKTFVVKTDDGSNKAQGGKRIMHTTHHPCWDAKNRHDLPAELPLEYSAIAHCIPTLTQKQAQTVPTPQPELETSKVPEVQPEPVQSKPETPTEVAPEPVAPALEVPVATPDELEGVPKNLADLMRANNVTTAEIQEVVAERGYYPRDTPITNYDPDFVDGVLVGAWEQVYDMILVARAPF